MALENLMFTKGFEKVAVSVKRYARAVINSRDTMRGAAERVADSATRRLHAAGDSPGKVIRKSKNITTRLKAMDLIGKNPKEAVFAKDTNPEFGLREKFNKKYLRGK